LLYGGLGNPRSGMADWEIRVPRMADWEIRVPRMADWEIRVPGFSKSTATLHPGHFSWKNGGEGISAADGWVIYTLLLPMCKFSFV